MQCLLLYLPLKVPNLFVKYAYFYVIFIIIFLRHITVFDKIQFYQFGKKIYPFMQCLLLYLALKVPYLYVKYAYFYVIFNISYASVKKKKKKKKNDDFADGIKI